MLLRSRRRYDNQTNDRGPSWSLSPESVATDVQRRTLLVVASSTLLVLATFVTPLATGVRTAAALGTGPAARPGCSAR